MTNKIRIAIIGAGLSGLSCCWHLLQNDRVSIDLYDPNGIGGGASGMAAGLLHPYAGRFARTNWMGHEGVQATKELLEVASQAIGKPVAEASGFLRVALNQENIEHYGHCAEKNEDVDWLSTDQTTSLVPGITSAPAILIKSALTVHGELYLQGLWKACEMRGAQLIRSKVDSLKSLQGYDKIVVTTGAHIHEIPDFEELKVTPVKGQLLDLEWPAGVPPLPLPISNQVYIVMSPDKKSCIAGSTFEHRFQSDAPVPEVAIEEIIPKVEALFPPLRGAKILGFRSGVRASTPDHKPFLKEVTKNCWVLVGMGSKGLLYHALFGRMFVQKLRTFLSNPL